MNTEDNWVSVTDRLPPERKYVIAKHNRGTWRDSDDQENVNTVIVKLVRGISIEERNQFPDTDPRKNRYTSDDEFGNNSVPYSWHEFGPDHFFGQSITHWKPIN